MAVSASIAADSLASRRPETIHVGIDPAEIGKKYPAELGVVGDAKSVLTDQLAHDDRTAASRTKGAEQG